MGRVMRFVVGLCLFLSGIVFVTWFLVPSLISDYKINIAKLEMSEVHLLETANCVTKVYVLARCEVSLSSGVDGIKDSINYIMLKEAIVDKVQLLVSETGVVTTNIGMKYFTNRVLTYLAFLMLLFVGLIVTWKRMISNKLLNY